MNAPSSKKDKLFLLEPDFIDPAYPGQRFYCWHCALIEGILFSFPLLLERVDVERIAWPRPRHSVIALAGEQNQSLPLLILAQGRSSKFQTGSFGGQVLIQDKDKILDAFSELYGIAAPHP